MWIVHLVLLTTTMTASAFTTTTTRATKNVSVSQEENRRQFFVDNTMKVLSFLLLPVSSSSANASLLDDYGRNPTKQMTQTVEAFQQQREIDPTLRGSYYYPTAKKRYLPRIKKVSDSLNKHDDDDAAAIPFSSIRSMEDWQNISNFCNGEADGAILPLKLYQSSLTGQGLSMSTSYSKVMKRDATSFESAVQDLHHAIQSKDEERAIRSISNLRIALNEYRDVGRLTGPDWGDDIPSVDDVRRMTMRHPTVKILDR